MSDTVLYKALPQQLDLTDEQVVQGAQERQSVHYLGIPLRDLTEADVDALPQWLQETLHADLSGLYEVTLAGKQRYTRKANERAAIAADDTPEE
jgi:hypothetical protein